MTTQKPAHTTAVALVVFVALLLPRRILAIAEATKVRFDAPSGLVVESGSSSLELQFGTWLRGEVLDESDESARLRFTVPLARPVLQAHLFDRRVWLFVQPELARDPRLLDAFAEWAPDPAFHLRLGQFRTPYSRAFITPIFQLQLPERGLVVDTFRLGRDTGLMAYGRLFGDRYEYAAGIFNGADINSLGGDADEPLAVGRLAVNFGQPVPYDQVPSLNIDSPRGLSFGLGAAWRDRDLDDDGAEAAISEESWHGGIDFALMDGPIAATGEAFLEEVRRTGTEWTDRYGAYTQIGGFVLPRRLEVGGRIGWVSDHQDALSSEAFLTFFWWYGDDLLGHHLKTTLAYRRDDYGRGASQTDFQQVLLQTQIWL